MFEAVFCSAEEKFVNFVFFVAVVLLLAVIGAVAAPVTFVVTPPKNTPPAIEIYLAGDFQGWQPGHKTWHLQRLDDGRFTITADLKVGSTIQFKFTRGSWLTVEKGKAGVEIANRSHLVSLADTLHLKVIGWASGKVVPRADTVVGAVELLSWPDFLDERQVWVYLPPGYESDTQRDYPVLYMFDGQNVFNEATSFAGEWRVDETLEHLIAEEKVAPMIVVAVANHGSRRIFEYTPWIISHRAESGGGQEHLRAWVDILIPRIDAHYRTEVGPENRGLAGSSLGGLMSLYGGFAYPEVFGKVGAFSPSLLMAGSVVFEFCAQQSGFPRVLYMDMGTREDGHLSDRDHDGIDDHIAALRQLREVLIKRGSLVGENLMVVEDADARHNESAWSRRFPEAVTFLFPATFP